VTAHALRSGPFVAITGRIVPGAIFVPGNALAYIAAMSGSVGTGITALGESTAGPTTVVIGAKPCASRPDCDKHLGEPWSPKFGALASYIISATGAGLVDRRPARLPASAQRLDLATFANGLGKGVELGEQRAIHRRRYTRHKVRARPPSSSIHMWGLSRAGLRPSRSSPPLRTE